MAKTFDDVLAVLKGVENGGELVEAATNFKLEAERSQSGYRTVQTNFDKLVGGLKPLGYESGDPLAFTSTLKEKLENGNQAGKKLTDKDSEIETIKKTLNILTEERNQAKLAANALAQRTLRETLNGKFKGKMIDPEGTTALVIQNGLANVGTDGSITWKDGIDFDKGIQDFMMSRPFAMVNPQTAGAGGGSAGGKAGKTMAIAEFQKLGVKEQHKFFQDGGELLEP
jgi:hypothetical protein